MTAKMIKLLNPYIEFMTKSTEVNKEELNIFQELRDS